MRYLLFLLLLLLSCRRPCPAPNSKRPPTLATVNSLCPIRASR
ncbi:MAG: hypothetical protein WKG07_43915 [Hymenobacter sp.]